MFDHAEDANVGKINVSRSLTGLIVSEILANLYTCGVNILGYKTHLEFGADFD